MKLLRLPSPSALKTEMDLRSLAQNFFATEGLTPPRWFDGSALPRMPAAVLLRKLAAVSQNDSTVQDIQTVGHLGKLLLRWDKLARTKAWELAGMPFEKLDALSRRDRVEFFRAGISLNRFGKHSLRTAQEILEREKVW